MIKKLRLNGWWCEYEVRRSCSVFMILKVKAPKNYVLKKWFYVDLKVFKNINTRPYNIFRFKDFISPSNWYCWLWYLEGPSKLFGLFLSILTWVVSRLVSQHRPSVRDVSPFEITSLWLAICQNACPLIGLVWLSIPRSELWLCSVTGNGKQPNHSPFYNT